MHAKTLGVIIGEKQLAAIPKRTILHTLSVISNSIDLQNTLSVKNSFQLSL